MERPRLKQLSIVTVIAAILLGMVGCARQDSGKIPLTTSSGKAREYYLRGRTFSENLRDGEAIEYYEKALAEDPNIAMVYLQLAFARGTSREFFQNFRKAKELLADVSEGERLWILSVEAGMHGNPIKQRKILKRLVEAYPKDERARLLLANHYFGSQEYGPAIVEYQKVADMAPDYPPTYNQIGYCYRFLEDYDEAEKALMKYIELIPDNPNPYDSYADLLAKMGKYGPSIENFRKALSIDPNFGASHTGIATNLNLMGKHKEAREQLDKLYEIATDDAQRRRAIYGRAISYIDEGNTASGLEELDRAIALAQKSDDVVEMAQYQAAQGYILIEDNEPEAALARFEEGLRIVEEADISRTAKDRIRLDHIYRLGRVAVAAGDLDLAKKQCREYRSNAMDLDNEAMVRSAHFLAGIIALEEKKYGSAIEELELGSRFNPGVVYYLAKAYQGKGDSETAAKLFAKAARFNILNDLSYSFVRNKPEIKDLPL